MSNLYGKAVPAANTITRLTTGTPSAGKARTVAVGMVNDNSDKVGRVRIYCASTSNAADVARLDLIASRKVEADGDLERTGIVVEAGEYLFVKSSVDGMVFNARGFEGKDK